MTTRTGGAQLAREQLSPVDGLAQLSFVIQGMLERRAAEYDLSIIQTRLLGVLRDRKPTMHELARFLGLDKSSVTGLVDRAERRGLVVRVPSTTDRRAVLVSLTDDGRSLVSQAAARFEADVLTHAFLPAAAGTRNALQNRQPPARHPRRGPGDRPVRNRVTMTWSSAGPACPSVTITGGVRDRAAIR